MRFMVKVEKVESGCWEWRASTKFGYGRFAVDGRQVMAHRWSYEHHVGPIPAGHQIDHLCRNRACVNPEHLEAVTPEENTLRSMNACAINAKKTHCLRGHELVGDNVYIRPGGSRICRSCERARGARSRAENPEWWRTYHREYKRRIRAAAKAA